MHGGEMGAGDAALQPQALGLVGEALDVTREGIVALVAVHVHQQAAPGGEFAELPHRFRAVCHGALEMRDADHDVDSSEERLGGTECVSTCRSRGSPTQTKINN